MEGVLLTVHHLPLLVQPAFGLIFSLQDDVVALQPTRKVVPSRGNHGVLSLEILDDLFVGGLQEKGPVSASRAHTRDHLSRGEATEY